ncbi:Usherin, partial [Varanus komodoensis]
MRKAGLDESPIGIKTAGRNINNLRYSDDTRTTLMAEGEEELKSLLMWVKEESAKVGLKFNIKKAKIMASCPFTSWQIDGEEMEVVTDFIFLGSKITTDGDCSQEIKRRLLLRRKAMANLDSILKSRGITLPTKVQPGPMDPPLLLDVKSRAVSISWQHPSKPNGIISHYNIYLNGQLHTTVPGITSKCTVHFLQPFTVYQFQVESCTSQGCSLSPVTLPVQTLPDAPEDIPVPELYSDTPTSVLISWQPPLHPNGLVENITIERRTKRTEQVSTVATLPFNYSKNYLDQSAALNPWKKYEYRILA